MGTYPFAARNDIAYIPPSNDQTGATDTAAINAALAAGKPVFLLPANPANSATFYYINGPIIPKTGSFLTGFQWYAASPDDNYGAGTGNDGGAVLVMVSAFAIGHYAIEMINTTGTQAYGADISGITIDGEAVSHITNPGAGGIFIHGAWGAGYLRGIVVFGHNADGLHFETDNSTGKVPDEWRVSYVKLSSSSLGYGVYAANLPDSSFTDVQASNNHLDGFYLNWSTNTRLMGCKSEQNGGAGYHFTGTAGTGDIVWLTACTTHINQLDGFLFDEAGGGTGQGTYQLANCGAVIDGQAGGTTYAGYRSNGCKDRIMAVGCSAQGAYYGASEVNSSYFMCFTGSWLTGTNSATHDDASNTHVLVNQSPVPF